MGLRDQGINGSRDPGIQGSRDQGINGIMDYEYPTQKFSTLFKKNYSGTIFE